MKTIKQKMEKISHQFQIEIQVHRLKEERIYNRYISGMRNTQNECRDSDKGHIPEKKLSGTFCIECSQIIT